MQNIKWAVLGCGHIAQTFMRSSASVANADVIACGASNNERAKAFAEKFSIAKHFGDYQSMLQERSIHAVYIATTHNFHFEHIMLCLRHGKHVLCEKPLTLNEAQAKQAFALAKQNNLLLVEAVWTRFLPAIQSLQKHIAKGTIGNVQCVQANFSLNRELPDSHRLNNKALAGGALLDLGIYPITIADIVFGELPINISSHHIKTHTGVDKNSFYTLEYASGAIAQLSSGFRMSGPTYANIMGDKGAIQVPFFLGAQHYTLTIEGEEPQRFDFPFDSVNNFSFEIEHVTQLLMAEKTSSHIMPAETSLRMMQIMDTIRKQWGLRYDQEGT